MALHDTRKQPISRQRGSTCLHLHSHGRVPAAATCTWHCPVVHALQRIGGGVYGTVTHGRFIWAEVVVQEGSAVGPGAPPSRPLWSALPAAGAAASPHLIQHNFTPPGTARCRCHPLGHAATCAAAPPRVAHRTCARGGRREVSWRMWQGRQLQAAGGHSAAPPPPARRACARLREALKSSASGHGELASWNSTNIASPGRSMTPQA